MHTTLARILVALVAAVSVANASAAADTTPVLSAELMARHNGHHTRQRSYKSRHAHHRGHSHHKKGHHGGHQYHSAPSNHHYSSSCGSRGSTGEVSTGAGPNGAQSYFNCGIKGSGWTPPYLGIDMIKTVSMESDAAKHTFAACQAYRSSFEKYGKEYDIPPVMLAAIAMQESSCNANTMGDNGGAFGLMQITKDKCGGAPGGNCRNVDFNIRVGAKTLKDCIDNANGNILQGLASYNGWFVGMTYGDATAVAKQECSWQQNLDYLQQMLNGWLLGVNPYSRHLGTIQNLARCGA